MTRLRVHSASSPASHPLAERRSPGVVRHVWLPLAFCLALLTTGCIDKPPLGPGDGTSAKLGLVASVTGLTADGDFWVEPIFTTPGEGAPDVLTSSPSRINLANNVTVQAITVDLGQCPDGCPVSAILVLHDDVDPDVLGADTLDLGVVHQGDAVAPADTMHLTPSYRLTIVGGGAGTGSGTVEVAAIGGEGAVSCVITDGQAGETGCVARYPLNTVISLVPAAPRGAVFEAWSGDCDGTAPEARCELVMDGRRTAGARFGLAPTTGDLEVQIAGLPEGAGALVTVTGPGGFNQNVSATDTLESLPPGDYTVSAEPVTVISQDLTYTPDPASQLVRVDAGAHAIAQVSYNSPTTGTLAVTIAGLPEGVAAQVTASGDGLPNGQSFPTSGQAPNLGPGEYTVTAATVIAPNGQPYDPTIDPAQPVEVSAGHVTTVTVTYAAPPATKLVFVTQPKAAASQAPITPPVTVEARDAQDRLAPGFTSHITLSLRGGVPGAKLDGAASAIPQRGVATFAGLTVDSAGSGYTLAALASPLPTTISDTFSILAGPVSPDRSSIEVSTTTLRNCCDTADVTVTARDAVGNAIQQATVVLQAAGDKVSLTQPPQTTGSDGRAIGALSSLAIGQKTVTAVINGVGIHATATVTVQAGIAFTGLTPSGDEGSDLHIWVTTPDGALANDLTPGFFERADQPAWSPDGSRIAFVINESSIYVMDADGSDTVNVAFAQNATSPSWGPDGQHIAFSNFDDVLIVDVRDRSVQNVTGGVFSFVRSVNWSSTGRLVIAADLFETTDLFVLDPGGGSPDNITNGSIQNPENPEWSGDGTTVAFNSSPFESGVNDIYTINVAEGADPVNLTRGRFEPPRRPNSPTWSPGGGRIAFADDNIEGVIWVMRSRDGEELTALELPGARYPAWR